ncbi:hypothetical protein [Bacillus sp. OK048]|nr:hypothetical protein [Bacillus sp. OK048]
MVIIIPMMTEIHEKIIEMAIIIPMITEIHEKNHKNGHHHPNDDQNS